jgi:hypothetical protein
MNICNVYYILISVEAGDAALDNGQVAKRLENTVAGRLNRTAPNSSLVFGTRYPAR